MAKKILSRKTGTKDEVLAQTFSDTSQVPRGGDIFYRCLQCGGTVPSGPRDSIGCNCGNIFIDTDYVRLVVRDFSKFQLIRRLPT
jgi:hypothetical protein